MLQLRADGALKVIDTNQPCSFFLNYNDEHKVISAKDNILSTSTHNFTRTCEL